MRKHRGRSRPGRRVKRLGALLLAFALLVIGIESLRVLVDWWQGGRPTPGWREWAAFAGFVAAAVAWWRHSVFSCGKRDACLLPPDRRDEPPRD